MRTSTRNGTVAAVWIGGVLLAIVAYAVGPDQVLQRAWAAIASAGDALWLLADRLDALSFDLLRALAIGAFGAFVLLAIMAIRRGLRGRAALIAVSLVFAAAIAPGTQWPDRQSWLLAFVLALTGAASMTGRLLRADVPPQPGPGRRRVP